jgi:hypothetical protein
MKFGKKLKASSRFRDATTHAPGPAIAVDPPRFEPPASPVERNGHADSTDARALMDTINAVVQGDSIDSVVRATLDTVRRAFGWAYASYWTIDPAQNALTSGSHTRPGSRKARG